MRAFDLAAWADAHMRGAAWLPVDDPASTCEEHGFAFCFVPCDDPELVERLEALREARVHALVSVAGPMGLVADEVGWTVALMSTETGELDDLWDAARARFLTRVSEVSSSGCSAVVVADDVSRELVSPAFVRSRLIPTYALAAETASAAGMPAVFHSDGDVAEHYAHLARVGFSGAHVAVRQDRIADACARARGAGLVALGGVPSQALSSPTRHSVARLLGALTAAGPLVVCDDGGMATEGDVESLARLYSTL